MAAASRRSIRSRTFRRSFRLARRARTIAHVEPKRSSRVRTVLLGWFALAIGVLLILRMSGIGLGQGSFAYLFSARQGERILRALWLLPVAASATGAMWLSARRVRYAPIVGIVAVVGFSAWTFFAPLQAIVQHSFNLRSPSHDGAFVNELYSMITLRAYLRDFDERIQKSPAELRGTRVISNPPGTTILFYGLVYTWRPNLESPGWLERLL